MMKSVIVLGLFAVAFSGAAVSIQKNTIQSNFNSNKF